MIVESWRRVLATGLDPTDLLPSIEADPSETRERWLEHPLGLLRHVLVEPLQLLAEESHSIVQVTDPSGLTLFLGGPDWLKELEAVLDSGLVAIVADEQGFHGLITRFDLLNHLRRTLTS